MFMKSLLAAALSLATAPLAHAATLTFYPSRSAFTAAEPGLKVQSFAAANLLGQTSVTQASPLNATTNDAVFARGAILPGLVIATLHPGSRTNALIVYAGGPVGTTSVGNNWFGDTLAEKFSPAVSAVAEDVFANTSAGTSFAGSITAQFFSGTRSLGARTFTEASGGSVFIGASSTSPITSVRITWASDNDATTYASTIAFGTPTPPQ